MRDFLQRFIPFKTSLFLLLIISGQAWAGVAPPPPPPIVSGSLTVCLGDSGIYTAAIVPADPNVVFRWSQEIGLGVYVFQFEGNPFSTGPLLLASNYRVIALDTISGLSSSPTDFSVTIAPSNIDVAAATPLDLIICNGDSTLFTATSTLGNLNFAWYDALTGGNLLFIGNPYNSGPLTTIPSIYVASLDANGCASPRVLVVQPVVLPAVDLPIPNPLVGTACSGSSTTFTASSLIPGATFEWYDVLTGGTPVQTGPTFTPAAKTNAGAVNIVDLYYVETIDAAGCHSLRVPVTQITLPVVNLPLVSPLAATICSGTSATYTASSLLGGSYTFYWYDSLTGGSPVFIGNPYSTTPEVNNGASNLVKIIYVELVDSNGCRSLRTPATTVIVPALDVPTATPPVAIACSGDSVTFTGSALLGGLTFNWYDAALGGNLLFTGNPYTTNAVTNPGTTSLINFVFVDVEDINGCKSLRTSATIITLPAIDVPVVSPPVATVCSGDSATFTASSLLGGTTFHWYNALTGGTEIFVGDTYTTSPITNNGASNIVSAVYVEVEDAFGCRSIRVPATSIITPAIDAAIVLPPGAIACNGSSSTFTATSILGGVTFNWYDGLLNGNLLFTGNPYNAPANNTSAVSIVNTIFVEVEDINGCKSVRTSAIQVVLPLVDLPVVTPPVATACNNDSVTFTTTSLLGGSTINWYDALVGGNLLATGPTYNTGPLSNTGTGNLVLTVYAEVEDSSGCKSLRAPGSVVITPAPAVPTVNPPLSTICDGGSTQFEASTLIGTGTEFYWYDSLFGGNLLFTGSTFTTGPITSTGPTDLTRTFFVEVRDANGCASLRTTATVAITPALDLPTVSPPLAAICNGNSATFTGSSLLGTAAQFSWYDSLTGGNLLFVGNPFNTGPINSTGITDVVRLFYLEVADSNGCKSLRSPAVVSITFAVDVPIITPPVQSICNGSSAEFVATSLLDSTAIFNWYDSISGGTLLFTGDTFNTGPQTSTGPLDLTRIFYAEVEDSSGCRSLRAPAVVTIQPALSLPVVNPIADIVCNGGSAQFVASSPVDSNQTYNWYDDILSGTLLFTGDTFNTGPLYNPTLSNVSYNYFVEAVDSLGCISARTPAVAVVLPAVDVAVVNPPVALICNGDSVEFTVSSLLNPSSTFRWYDAISNGNLLFIGDTFNTGPVNNPSGADLTRSYYVETIDSNGCASLRTPATVIIRPALGAPTATPPVDLICNGGSAEFAASYVLDSIATFNWYDSLMGVNPVFTGDTFNTGPLFNLTPTDVSKVYYLEAIDSLGCKSIRTAVTAIIRPAFDIPVVMPPAAMVCSGTSAEFVASSLVDTNATFRWYDEFNGGNLLFVGDTFNTGPLTNNELVNVVKAYFVEAIDSNGCVSQRVPAVVAILPSLAAPVVPPVAAVCSGSSATLVANDTLAPNAVFNWYDSLTAVTPIFTGDTFVTGPLVSNGPADLTRVFYVEAQDSSGCKSLRVAVVVVLTPALDVPVVNPPVAAVCNGTSATFIASSTTPSNVTFNWYDQLSNGTLLFTGDTFTTGPLTNPNQTTLSQQFFVEAVDSSGCKSVRAAATALITPAQTAPVVSPLTQTICSGDSATFSASTPVGIATDFRWYDALTGGNLLFIGDTFNTGPVTVNGSTAVTRQYYVEAFDSIGCTSARTAANLTIIPNPDVLVLVPANSSICEGDSTTIAAISTFGNQEINWYLVPVGDTAIFTGAVYNTGQLTQTITYYVSSTQSTTGCASERYPVTIAVNDTDALQAPAVNCERVDNNTIRFDWSEVTNSNGYEVSNDNGVTWKTPSSGFFGRTHIETRSSNDQKGATLQVRALNRANDCAPREGISSIGVFCTFFEGIAGNFKPNNSFSPNGDGANDSWYISEGIEFYPKNTVSIFNRWGKEVFRTRGYNNSNNVFDGDGLDDGAYFYVVTIPELNLEKTGYVMIIR